MALRIKQNTYQRLKVITRITLPLLSAVALIVAFIALGQAENAKKGETPYEAAITTDRASFQAKNFLEMWLSATPQDRERLGAMFSGNIPELNPAPTTVVPNTFNVADVERTPVDEEKQPDTFRWVFTIAATVQVPGVPEPQRQFFTVTLVEHKHRFRPIALPHPTTAPRSGLKANLPEGSTQSLDSAVGVTVSQFVDAYFTRSTDSNLGRYVSRNFDASKDAKPVKDSIYTGSEVLSITTSSMATSLNDVAPGKTIDVLVTMKLSASNSTFVNSQVYLTLVRTDNGQWLVDAINDAGTPVGGLSVQNN